MKLLDLAGRLSLVFELKIWYSMAKRIPPFYTLKRATVEPTMSPEYDDFQQIIRAYEKAFKSLWITKNIAVFMSVPFNKKISNLILFNYGA